MRHPERFHLWHGGRRVHVMRGERAAPKAEHKQVICGGRSGSWQTWHSAAVLSSVYAEPSRVVDFRADEITCARCRERWARLSEVSA